MFTDEMGSYALNCYTHVFGILLDVTNYANVLFKVGNVHSNTVIKVKLFIIMLILSHFHLHFAKHWVLLASFETFRYQLFGVVASLE